MEEKFLSQEHLLTSQQAESMTKLDKPFLIPEVVNQMSAVGGLLIVGIGINLLEIKKISVGNMLPAMFLPLLYYIVRQSWPA